MLQGLTFSRMTLETRSKRLQRRTRKRVRNQAIVRKRRMVKRGHRIRIGNSYKVWRLEVHLKERKKIKGPSTSNNHQQQNGNSSNNSNSSSSSSKEPFPNGAEGVSGVADQNNGNLQTDKKFLQKPKGLSAAQWEQWQKRDADIVDETYASDLQTALLQSKLEYDTELKNKPPGKGKKKKPVAVSLTDFNARLTEGVSSSGGQNVTFNGGNSSILLHYQSQPQGPYDNDEELVEKFRQEARLEIERERQLAIERQLLMSRQPPPPIARPTPIHIPSPEAASASSGSAGPNSTSEEKDLLINSLTEENARLRGDISFLKERVKAINNYLQAAHDVKDKAKLIYDLETMTKSNNDLKEELSQVLSQLEQEKSRASAAMLELRRVLENRRRTTTEGSS